MPPQAPERPSVPDFHIEERHLEQAEKLTSFYRHIISERPQGERFRSEQFVPELRSVAEDTPLRDVTNQAEQFSQDLDFAVELGLPIPMFAIPEVGKIPILGASDAMPWIRFPPYERFISRTARTAWPDENILLESPDVAREGFFSALRQFLEYRIAGYAFWKRNYHGAEAKAYQRLRRKWTGGRQAPPVRPPPSGPPSNPLFAGDGGLIVTLRCQNHHLRALASTAIGIEWHQFGSPTSPVTGILQPGLWLFAADGGVFGSSLVVDYVTARIPPLLTPCATAF